MKSLWMGSYDRGRDFINDYGCDKQRGEKHQIYTALHLRT